VELRGVALRCVLGPDVLVAASEARARRGCGWVQVGVGAGGEGGEGGAVEPLGCGCRLRCKMLARTVQQLVEASLPGSLCVPGRCWLDDRQGPLAGWSPQQQSSTAAEQRRRVAPAAAGGKRTAERGAARRTS
jgi:hypothetical protein